ncbi:hypothetical protein L843_5543 [Mycobacterium intracellulare MIN_061107_1834]|nr:hypothetical protein L843_5543 [Mycobacterium intracellulare MIN_061107_1834]
MPAPTPGWSGSRREPGPAGPGDPGPRRPAGWDGYGRGAQFLAALAESRAARAVWQALPGEP